MDVTGQWYYAKWLGGGCRLDQGDESNPDVGAKGVIFSEGENKIPLHYSSDGWWEGPTDSGLRVCRRERYLILHRRKGDKDQYTETRAASSMCRAACLCYMSPLKRRSVEVKPGKGDSSAPLVPAVKEEECVPEPECIPEPAVEEAVKEEPPVPAEKEEPSSTQSEAGSQEGSTDDFWPEPESEGLPEQPSTAQDPDHLINPETPSEELPETTSDERLVQHPQVGSYCLGVTSRGHSPGTTTNVILLGEHAYSVREPPSKQMIESLGNAPELDYPEGTPDATGVNLAIVEDSQETHTPPEGLSPKSERVVAEVDELRTTIHGLLAVPENAELPDVPCPMAPSKSDASLLHGGSIIFDGGDGHRPWLRDDGDIPQEVSILHRESATPPDAFPIELGTFTNGEANLTQLGEPEPVEESRPRPNPLVRSHKVSGNLQTRKDQNQ